MKKRVRSTAFALALVMLFTSVSVGANAGAGGVTVTADIAQFDLAELDAVINELSVLRSLCELQGIPCEYETVNIAVLERYRHFLAQDKANNFAPELEFTLKSLNRLYAEAKGNLLGYLDGTRTAQSSPQYLTGERELVGGSIYAPTTAGRRPVYFVGYGHFGTAAGDVPVMNALGANIIQNEIGPSAVIVPRGTGSREGLRDDDMFDINTAAITGRIIPLLQNAAQHNVCVSLLISPHYFPGFLYNLYPDLAFPDSDAFIKYHINHPVARRVMEVYLRTLIPLVAEYPSLFNICLTNEPVYVSLRSDYDLPQWREHLQTKYGTIAQMNDRLGVKYAGFEDVPMPAENERGAFAAEWVLFNNRFFADWHRWLAESIRDYTDTPIDTKIMSYMSYNPTSQWRGTDIEQYAEFTDFNGHDTWSSIDNKNFKMFYKTAWYDFMGDVKDAPIFNSEDHIIGDRSKLYSDKENALLSAFVGADMWQGAIHGRDASTIWVWERSFDPTSDLNGSILHRPECIASVGKAALDINRLAFEVRAFDNAPEDVAILFANTARSYDPYYTNFVLLAVEAAACAGKSVRFVTENTIDELENGKLLIIPNATHVKVNTLTVVNRYATAGNSVLLLGRCMDRDEYGNMQDAALLKDTYAKCLLYGNNILWDTVGPLAGWLARAGAALEFLNLPFLTKAAEFLTTNRNALTLLFVAPVFPITARSLRDKILKIAPSDVMFMRGVFNTPVMNAAWRVTEHEGRLLINVCNYSNTPIKKVSLVYKGQTLETLEELIGARTVEDGFTLEPYTPMLFAVDIGT